MFMAKYIFKSNFKHQISIVEWFLKDHSSNDAEKSALSSQEYITFEYIIKQKSVEIVFHNITVFTVFFSKLMQQKTEIMCGSNLLVKGLLTQDEFRSIQGSASNWVTGILLNTILSLGILTPLCSSGTCPCN